jgi:glycosyltransferase involved in cell wall biosynthesis
VSEEEKCWYYRKCLAFALPSRAEGFGLPVIEAMHYGKPVFLSNLAALPEIGGEAAYYFESFDAAAMQEVFRTGLADYEAAGRSAAIRRHALRYSWDDAAAAYLRLYRQWERR